jgi:exodeoxyribonuclease-5
MKKSLLFAMALGVAFASCSEKEVPLYDTDNANFIEFVAPTEDTASFSFMFHPEVAADGAYDLAIPVKILGQAKNVDREYKVIVVDEVSMAPMELMKLLLSHKDIYVICLGDPFQLPPVDKDQDNRLLENPHIFLDEIMRQAQESEIIRVSMAVREGKPLLPQNGEEVKILPKEELNEGMLLWADQVLCATNATRISLNNQMRNLLGRTGAPQDGDKVICLRNYWDDIAINQDPLVNGTIGYLQNSYSSFSQVPAYLGGYRFETTCGNFVSDSGALFPDLEMDKKMILTGEKCCNWKVAYTLGKNMKTAHLVPKEFTYGYAITGHKAQGSEWDKVLVVEEGFPFAREEHARWLYTCVTRAAEKLVLIKK